MWVGLGLCRLVMLFFFQAEDGIRDLTVTGVQTCALPICMHTAARQYAYHWTGTAWTTTRLNDNRPRLGDLGERHQRCLGRGVQCWISGALRRHRLEPSQLARRRTGNLGQWHLRRMADRPQQRGTRARERTPPPRPFARCPQRGPRPPVHARPPPVPPAPSAAPPPPP